MKLNWSHNWIESAIILSTYVMISVLVWISKILQAWCARECWLKAIANTAEGARLFAHKESAERLNSCGHTALVTGPGWDTSPVISPQYAAHGMKLAQLQPFGWAPTCVRVITLDIWGPIEMRPREVGHWVWVRANVSIKCCFRHQSQQPHLHRLNMLHVPFATCMIRRAATHVVCSFFDHS